MYQRWQDWLLLVFGSWLFLSPWILGYDGAAAVTSRILAGLIVIVAWLGLRHARRWQAYVNVGFGVLAFLSPLFIFTPECAGWNHMIIAVLVISSAVSALRTEIDPILA